MTTIKMINLNKYAKFDFNKCEITIPLRNTYAHTNGVSYWNNTLKRVRLTKIVINIELTPTDDEEYMFFDMNVFFTKNSWDISKDGLIYTDKGFIQEFRNILISLGFDPEASADVRYSEQGMQGENWVNFDAYKMEEYVRKLITTEC
jgi:hypothetical protein